MEAISLDKTMATTYGNAFSNIAFEVTVKDENDNNKKIAMFADFERTDDFDPAYAMNCGNISCNCNNSPLIHNLHQMNTPFYKSAIYKKSKTVRQNNTYDFQNITARKLSDDVVSMTRLENTLYAIGAKSPYGHYEFEADDIYSTISSQDSQLFPEPSRIKTAIYDKQQIDIDINNDNYEKLADDAVSVNLENIEYNMLFEIPGQMYNDYNSGNIAANSFKTKNQFDSVYDMKHSNENVLENARNYLAVDSCNNQLYMTYQDNINYENISSEGASSNVGIYGTTFDKVEIVKNINRYADMNGHKSNLYGIVINTNLFNKISSMTGDAAAAIRENAKQEVKNNVRKIVEKLMPTQTQLLSVFINDI